jgi:hypothetical protein
MQIYSRKVFQDAKTREYILLPVCNIISRLNTTEAAFWVSEFYTTSIKNCLKDEYLLYYLNNDSTQDI